MALSADNAARYGVPSERLRAYDEAARPDVPADAGLEMARHVAVEQVLSGRGEHALARGAARVSTTLALRLATRPITTDAGHAEVVDALRGHVAAVPEARRADLARLLDAALDADARRRVAAGPAPRGDRLRGWFDGLPQVDDAGSGFAGVDLGAWDVVRYAAAADDVGRVLTTAVRVMHDLLALPATGRTTEGAWSKLEEVALGPCAEPATTRAERLDRRRLLTPLWLTLRRRRPVAAAVLRRRLALDRGGRPGSVA